MIVIGQYHYKDRKEDQTRIAGKSKPVRIEPHGSGGYSAMVDGLRIDQLPRPLPTINMAIERGRKWITKNGGTCYKLPKGA